MLTITNGMLLSKYKKSSDKEINVKNFRLFYEEKPTNLIWYDGKIIFLPKEYFELKNLVNIDISQKQKCSLFASDYSIIKELKKQNIQFILEPSLEELVKRLKISGIEPDDDMSIELVDDNNYSKITEQIYLGNGVWLN